MMMQVTLDTSLCLTAEYKCREASSGSLDAPLSVNLLSDTSFYLSLSVSVWSEETTQPDLIFHSSHNTWSI